MKLRARLEPVRRWIDGEKTEPFLLLKEQEKPRRAAEEFLVRIAREIDSVMNREAFTPPGGPTYLPREFVVFLSHEDDGGWNGDKRRALEQGLTHVLGQRTTELFGGNFLNTRAFSITLRADATLAKWQFRVKALWDVEAGTTTVSARGFGSTAEHPLDLHHDNEITIVYSRPRSVLYSIQVKRDGVSQCVLPVTKPEITIGRGSQLVQVDVPIIGDAEVSRIHGILSYDVQGGYLLTSKGRNLLSINGYELQREEQRVVAPEDQIKICSFSLQVHEVANAVT